MKKETSVSKKVFFEEKKVCNLGTARYKTDEAKVSKFTVTNDFAAAVRNLPEEYNQGRYLKFIDDWGTVSVLQFLT